MKRRLSNIIFSRLLCLLLAGIPGTVLAQTEPPPISSLLHSVLQAQQEEEEQAQNQNGNETALPAADNVTPRAPGMQLSGQSPFAAQVSGTSGLQNAAQQPSRAEIEADIRRQSFDAAITGLLPLKPEEIKKMLMQYDQVQEVIEKPIYPYPQPEVVVETISLDPGSTPPLIKLATDHVSTLNILDATGSPWPIQDISWAGNFEIVQPEEGAHVVRMIPLSEFAHGNMSVRLLELKTPVVFTLETHRDVVQYRFDARIPQTGPDAKVPLIEGGVTLTAGDSTINSILDGVAPDGAVRLTVNGVDGRTTAYRLNGQTYVRTPLTLLSPGWNASISSADGMHVYAMGLAPVLLLSDQGRVTRVLLNEEGNTDE